MSEDPIPTQRNRMLRPAHCLTCRATEGGGQCDYCKEKWKQIADTIRRISKALSTDTDPQPR